MTLRGRLLLALAYILLLAIVALEVPLAISLRDRVDAEVRSQARSQADLVAATVAGNLDDAETLDVHVRWLRQKLGDDPADPRFLHTVRGVGFRFTAPEERS